MHTRLPKKYEKKNSLLRCLLIINWTDWFNKSGMGNHRYWSYCLGIHLRTEDTHPCMLIYVGLVSQVNVNHYGIETGQHFVPSVAEVASL